jgi:hypothetical protein
MSLASIAIAFAQEKPPAESKTDSIRLLPEQIPAVSGPLKVLRLSTLKPPVEFVEQALGQNAAEPTRLAPLSAMPQPAPEKAKLPQEILGAMREGALAAYVDTRTGDAEVFPSLKRTKNVAEAQEGALLERASSRAREIFERPDILPRDATRFSLERPRPLYGQTAERSGTGEVKAASSEIYLTYVTARRSVGDYFVYGPGSRALVAFGNDGTVQGFQRRWKAAAAAGEVSETRSRAEVAEAIRSQLGFAARTGEVEVMNVDVAYYDGHREYLQPVYRFTARIHESAAPGGRPSVHVDDDFVIGYVPIGKPLEPVPTLLARAPAGPSTPARGKATPPRPGDPTVGRYVVRNDDPNWVANANEFYAGLTSFFGGPLFTNSQYYWAYPFEFTSDESGFINTVNVALNEVHGDWWLFSTLKNCCDLVDITAIPASSGYGPASGGNLDFWVLHSCEVVPSAIDAPCPSDSRPWWTPWFNIFQGVHSVVGYRTIMWIDDDVTGPFATSLRLGAPVVSAWFNATTSAAGYQGNPTYGAHCGRKPPMGRPSTVSACGHEGEWIYDTTRLAPASCLVNYWQPN